ncbi:MAG: 6,7-dimethyl-8-ribityllumazine synthase [Bdellovibrionaceae bacterium]|nr:6,7-dimethyl-8-ribityllumazine synthase [Pseudobdellovibrionaceae bacterium]
MIFKGDLEKIQSEGHEFVVGIVTSRFNETITEKLRAGALQVLNDFDVNYFDVEVPGAVEIPLAAQWLIEEKKCDAVIALGCVIRGETAHFDFVCNSVERGCTQLQLEYSLPVVFGVLTTEDGFQAEARAGGAKGNKGKEAAFVALEMLSLKNQLEG